VNLFAKLRIPNKRPINPFSDSAWDALVAEHPILRGMTARELIRLRELSSGFNRTVAFEGADGLRLDESMRAVISLQAALPILCLGLEWYRSWKTVIVVPDVFIEEHSDEDAAGVVHEWEEDKSGESWDQGPVLLSWKDVEASGWGDGYNVVIHEAAHRLDMTDGKVNGRPALHADMRVNEWREVFSNAFREHSRRTRRRTRKPRMDSYAAHSDSEFFAVASEYFFERPRILKSEYPDVYRLLSAFYRQDPGARLHARA
jgi:Mlc titration factor MtfA (ptsG expression regulator)